MKNLKILLIGQPNVGKSSLLNTLVGPRVTVSNYPGTTVEVTKAQKRIGKIKVQFEDTPGIYSISDRSEEEKITEKALFEEGTDGVVVIVDATNLERSLYVVLQILEANIPMVIALNFVEEAEKKGIIVDKKKLEKILNVPVALINPLTKKGIKELEKKILNIRKKRRTFKVEYDDHIEEAIKKMFSQIKGKLPKRFIALRILEKDEDFYSYLKEKDIIKKVQRSLKEHPDVARDIAITRYGTASLIAEKVTQLRKIEKIRGKEEKIDDILLHRWLGPVITIFSLLALFGALLYLGNLIQGYLMDLTTSALPSSIQSTEGRILMKSLTGLTAGISIALPYVFLFYLILSLFEDTGLLSRFIVNMQRYMKKIGLPTKSFIPLALGLGCTVPATRAGRVLSDKKEQFYATSFLSFVPCSSRTAIIMGIVGFYGGVYLALAVFVTLFIVGLIWALILKKFSKKEELLLLELPPYRKPLMKNLLVKSWIRMRSFVYVVIPLLIIGGAILGILDEANLTQTVVKPLSFITKWLGLPALTIIPITFGFLQKDLTGSMLLSVLGNNISLTLSSLQLYTFGLATTIGIPCINAFGMLWKEFGLKKAVSLTLTSIGYGLFFAGLIWRIVLIL